MFHNTCDNDNSLLLYYIIGLVHQSGYGTVVYANTLILTRNREYDTFIDYFSLNTATSLRRIQRQKIQHLHQTCHKSVLGTLEGRL